MSDRARLAHARLEHWLLDDAGLRAAYAVPIAYLCISAFGLAASRQAASRGAERRPQH